uniref:Uncharacterized protein n=1 Tax=Arundo donax TaxID=35708 RepID=A0A0A8YD72_ARUDO
MGSLDVCLQGGCRGLLVFLLNFLE